MGEIFSATLPYIQGFNALVAKFQNQSHLFILQSSYHDHDRGRYSFIGFNPHHVISADGPKALQQLREDFHRIRSEVSTELTPLPYGYVGLIGYEFGLYQEKISPGKKDTLSTDVWFGYYETVITIDHVANKIHVTSVESEQMVTEVVSMIVDNNEAFIINSTQDFCLQLESSFTKIKYLDAVERARDYIAQGDIYQVNLSQKFELSVGYREFSPLLLYTQLTNNSPVPFGCFLKTEHVAIVSNSPERFIRLKDNVLQTRPMKGTAKRGSTFNEDAANKSALIMSKKEQAELLMITDLLRNDLGRVCEFGSVQVTNRREIESYQTVYQATSTIEGIKKNNLDSFDVLTAMLPGGSITGCPKVRAMEIINELEPHPRGAYTGTLGYINPKGDMDFNILIRTLVVSENSTSFQVGGGIVYDSVAEKEFEETLIKAEAIRKTMEDLFSSQISLT